MSRKPLLILLGAVILLGVVGVYGLLNLPDLVFDQIPYNYQTYVSLPPNSPGEGSLGGYLTLEGKGRNFVFKTAIPGAQKAYANRGDMEFLAYTEEGLEGNGTIESLDVNLDTITSLIAGDFKGAVFNTPLSGLLDYRCAGWTGNGTFNNTGSEFTGTFIIEGVHTHWEGNFTFIQEGNRIKMPATYIYHPQGKPELTRNVTKVFYL